MTSVVDKLLEALDWLFGCHHSKLSRVFTLHARTYRVCCACGREFEFCWETLSVKSS
jgi:hypothetical protein